MTDDASTPAAVRGAIDGGSTRELVGALLGQGKLDAAIQAARALCSAQPGAGTWRFLRNLVNSPVAEGSGLKPVRLALLSSFSSEFLHDSLVALGFASGLKIELLQAGFGTFRQELLNPDSALYAWSPDVVVLAIEGEDWLPELYRNYMDLPASGGSDAVRRFTDELGTLVAAFRARSRSPLLLHNLALPAWRALGLLDARTDGGQGQLIGDANAAVAKLARAADGVHVVDYAALVNRYGALNWYDDRMRLYAKAPIAGPMQPHLTAEYVKFLAAIVGAARKCLVVDLDNTLWGGVVGEDGVDGIALDANYPGSAFVEFQHCLLDLHARGVILAVASKNNPDDVDEVFARHRFMVLKKEHFAAAEIHWEPKSQSLVRISERLSIGLEHIVFVDDNPAECEEVRRALPMVRVLQLPAQPERYCRVLQEAGLFDTLSLSAEDRRRGALYRQRAQAEAARGNVASVEDYYRDLAMELAIAPIDRVTLSRAAQLTQKTNQFNVTTRRYSEAEISARMEAPDWIATTIGVKDRFGDNGIVGVLMAQHAGQAVEVDTLLLSCRVIGRTVETAMLAHLCDAASRCGATEIRANVVATPKNVPARDVFERHGFLKTAGDGSGTTSWRLDLAGGRVDWPAWFRRAA